MFHAFTGHSISAYIRGRRLSIATKRLKDTDKMMVVGLAYAGKNLNQEIGDLWQEFTPTIHEIKTVVPSQVSYEICEPLEESVEDVDLDNPNDFKYLAGVQVSRAVEIPYGMKVWHVDHQKYAVFAHRGPVELLGDTYKTIYSTCLPESGYTVEFTKDFEMYDEQFKPGQDD